MFFRWQTKNNSKFKWVTIISSDLKSRLAGGGGSVSGLMAGDGANSERVSMLEKKLFSVQEELTELHRRRSENAQQIIDQVCLLINVV